LPISFEKRGVGSQFHKLIRPNSEFFDDAREQRLTNITTLGIGDENFEPVFFHELMIAAGLWSLKTQPQQFTHKHLAAKGSFRNNFLVISDYGPLCHVHIL